MAVVVFTPIMAWLTHAWGWEHVFLWMGGVGLVLAAVWFAWYKEPHKDPRLTEEEKNLMREGGALVDLDSEGAVKAKKSSLRDAKCLFTNRNLWAIYLGQYCITALTYFLLPGSPST